LASPIVRFYVDRFVNDPAERFLWNRRMEVWEFGSGNDYSLPEED
jgi:hypothetical protein